MRITKQPSGGRGEYEIAGETPNGLKPTDLIDRPIYLQLGRYKINVGVRLTTQGGKRRLRRISNSDYPQVQLQVAALLMMPKPIREERRLEGGLPVLQTDRYLISDIELGNVQLAEDGTVQAEVIRLDYQNQAFQAEQLNVAARIKNIEDIWTRRTEFPQDIAGLLDQHSKAVQSGGPIPRSTIVLVENLQKRLADHSTDLEIEYFPTTDVVPVLLNVLGEVEDTSPVPIDQIEPEQIELRRREIKKWRKAASRGASGVKFRENVRQAYNSRCIMCGCRFPKTNYNSKPGVDAAHILPWAEYALDQTYNGIALCKLHHWAFDEGILTVVYRDGVYFVEMPGTALQNLAGPEFSLDILRQAIGEIPIDRLPSAKSNWPRPELLQKLNEQLDLALDE